MTNEEGERIYALVVDEMTPSPGFERHFVQVVKGNALPATPKEREWLEKAREIIAEQSPYHVDEGDLAADREESSRDEEHRSRVERMLETHTWEETMEILNREGYFSNNY